MRIDVYHHIVLDGGTAAKINLILGRTGQIMATQQEILDKLAAQSAMLDEQNVALDGIQSDITALKALVDSGADLDTIGAAVDGISVKIGAVTAKAQGIDTQTP